MIKVIHNFTLYFHFKPYESLNSGHTCTYDHLIEIKYNKGKEETFQWNHLFKSFIPKQTQSSWVTTEPVGAKL